jgi:hypothetical protein
MKQKGTVDPKVETCQLQSPDILVVSRVLSEVLAIHGFENEGKWVLLRGINPDGRYEILVIVTGETEYQYFPVQPLPAAISKQNTSRLCSTLTK